MAGRFRHYCHRPVECRSGIVQERRAEKLCRLKKLAAPDARVLRDGHHVIVSSRDLVPGDMVYLEAGNHVPADMRLLEAVNLQIEEAALTGESLPVQKNAAMQLKKIYRSAIARTLLSWYHGQLRRGRVWLLARACTPSLV